MLFITDRSKAVVVYSNCHCSATSCLSLTFCSFCLGWSSAGKELASWFSAFQLWIIRIFNGCEVMIKNSVTRVTV